jgi:hypothetical protein
MDPGCAALVQPFGENSCTVRREEIGPNRALYERVANALGAFARIMNPPPVTGGEVVARAIVLMRAEGFFSVSKTADELSDFVSSMIIDLCGAPIEAEAAAFLAEQAFSGRQAALRRGFGSAAGTLQ